MLRWRAMAGWPPRRPWASAAGRPSRVRSRIRSRSVSAAINSILSAMVAPSGRWKPAQMPDRMCRSIPRARRCFRAGPSVPSSSGRPGPACRSPGCRQPPFDRGVQLGPLPTPGGGLDHDLPAVCAGEGVELRLHVLGHGWRPGRSRSERCRHTPRWAARRRSLCDRPGTRRGTLATTPVSNGIAWGVLTTVDRPGNGRFRAGRAGQVPVRSGRLAGSVTTIRARSRSLRLWLRA